VQNRNLGPSWLPALAGIAAVLSAGLVVWLAQDFGRFSAHMAAHIAVMNVLAPLVAIILAGCIRPPRHHANVAFWSAATLQILALWFWHVPAVQAAAMQTGSGTLLMQVSLFLIATLFWTCVVQARGNARWQAILGLVITGKLSCLLAALFIFSPRFLYAGDHHAAAVWLGDQQLAGLLMITACPLSYLTAGLVLALQLSGFISTSSNARTA
jgi:putative membrane protein